MNLKETLKLDAINRTKQRVRIATTSNPVSKIFDDHERFMNLQQIEFEYSKRLYNHYCQELGLFQ